MKKNKINSKRKRKKIIYSDKVQKSSILNSVYLLAEYNRNSLKSLNNAYRNYLISSTKYDRITDNNLRIIGFQRIRNMKLKLRHSNELLKEFDDKYIFNRNQYWSKKNNSETYLLKNLNKSEENKCLNISDINKKSKEKKDNNQKNDTINRNISSPKVIKKLKTNRNINIRSYTTKNYSKINQKRNSENKYLLITKDIEKNSKRMKKIDKLSNLYEEIHGYIRNQSHFLKENKKKRYYNCFREKIEKERPKSTNNRYRRILWIPKSQSTNNKTCTRCSSAFNKTNETTINKNKKIINNISTKSIKYNKSDLNHNFSSTSNIVTSGRTRKKINYSTSSSLNSTEIRQIISSPFLFSTRNKTKYTLSKRADETNKEIESIVYKTIKESNKINNEVRKNYSSHKEPKIKIKIKKNSLAELLNDNKIDLVKLRKELKLKDSNGLLGEINEIEILERDLKKMSERLSKKRLNILKPIARSTIRESLLLNKEVIYNVGIEHNKYRKKYFKLYNILTRLKDRKKLVEDFIIN